MATSTTPFKNLLERARPEGLADYLDSVCAECVLLVSAESDTLGCSRIGGRPDLPQDMEWPTWDVTAYDQKELEEARRSQEKHPTPYMQNRVQELESRLSREPLPLSFISQLNLRDFAESTNGLELPEDGWLWFFYELSENPWGYCPTHRGGFRVLYAPAGSKLEPRDGPTGTEVLPTKPIQGKPAWSVPTWPQLEDELVDAYCDLLEDIAQPDPCHQIGGHPNQIQGDMARSCALVTQGIYLGRPPDLPREELDKLASESGGWKLLLQISSDDDLGLMWGDVGSLFWWMKTEDLAQGAWDQAWFQLQSG